MFFFYLAVLSLFRLAFIAGLSDYLAEGTGAQDVLTALWRGARLSMQTAGALTVPSLLLALILALVRPRWERSAWLLSTGAVLCILSVLFVASFPFYRQFRMNFNQMLYAGAHDDWWALLCTMTVEHALPVRLAAALLLFGALLWLLRRFLTLEILPPLYLPAPVRYLGRVLYLGVLYLAGTLAVFGGSLGWQTAVDWENAGVTKDTLLNEAILDSPQAIWRAHELNRRMLACNGLNFTAEDIRLLAAVLTHKEPVTDDLDYYLAREAMGASVEKPEQIFVILSESLANWPLLDKYEYLGVAPDLRALLAESTTDYSPSFLPDGASTVSAVMGVVTGFADANLYLTTMPEAYAEPYPTAAAPNLSRLGYRARFFYAGPATWERIGDFTRAQGFEEFYSRGDYGDVPGSVWGCEDESLYANVLTRVGESPSFNVILNASNHSPYDVDVDAKGFPREKVREALGDQATDELLKELGHYWYAQRELVRFVAAAREKYPKSLFIIVGDHGDRYNIEKQPRLYERYGVPFIVCGAGVKKGTLLADSAGSQIDIMPTIVEMIAPKGFKYTALGESLTRTARRGVNYGFFITRGAIGEADALELTGEPLREGEAVTIPPDLPDYINAIRAISWYRPKYGAILDEEKLKDR